MAFDLLAAHDAGEALSPPERALLLARFVGHEQPDPLEPVGITTARLLGLYEQLTGPELAGTATCPGCDAIVEFTVEISALLALESGIVVEPVHLDHAGAELNCRPISYGDLVAASSAPDAVTALLERCVDGPVPAAARAVVSDTLAAADPLAEVQLDLACPDCGAEVRAELDVITFTWSRIVAGAEALLSEVDVLARVYSWSESEILALSPGRRRRFVALAAGDT